MPLIPGHEPMPTPSEIVERSIKEIDDRIKAAREVIRNSSNLPDDTSTYDGLQGYLQTTGASIDLKTTHEPSKEDKTKQY